MSIAWYGLEVKVMRFEPIFISLSFALASPGVVSAQEPLSDEALLNLSSLIKNTRELPIQKLEHLLIKWERTSFVETDAEQIEFMASVFGRDSEQFTKFVAARGTPERVPSMAFAYDNLPKLIEFFVPGQKLATTADAKAALRQLVWDADKTPFVLLELDRLIGRWQKSSVAQSDPEQREFMETHFGKDSDVFKRYMEARGAKGDAISTAFAYDQVSRFAELVRDAIKSTKRREPSKLEQETDLVRAIQDLNEMVEALAKRAASIQAVDPVIAGIFHKRLVELEVKLEAVRKNFVTKAEK